MILNAREWILEYTFQRKRKLILIINRGFSKTVIGINISLNHIGDSRKMLIKGIGDNLMISSAPTINIYWL
jgi:hypothetical protein